MTNVVKMKQTITSTPTLKTMSYTQLAEVMKDYFRGTFRPGIVKQRCAIGDKVLLVSQEEMAFGGVMAVAMVGTVISEGYENTRPMLGGVLEGEVPTNGVMYDVEWKSFPVEIDPNYTCVQGGYISLDDRAEILAQLI